MDDELFGDLLGPKPSSSTAPGKTGGVGSVSSVKGLSDGSGKSKPVLSDEDVGATGLTLGSGASDPKMNFTLSSEELSALIEKGVQTALDTTFSKFVRSLKTVLEDMTRRISSQEASVVELRSAITELRDVVADQPAEFHVRFSNLDMAIKDVERGVQALRDRQELQEAQQLLAMMSSDAARGKGQSSTAGAASSAPSATAEAAVAPAPAASAGTSAAVSTAANTPLPVAAPGAAPPSTAQAVAPAPPPAGMGAAPAAAPPAAAATAPAPVAAPPPGPAGAAPQPAGYGVPQLQPQQPQLQPQMPVPGYGMPAPAPMGMPGAPPLPDAQHAHHPQALQQQPQQQQQSQQQQQPFGAPPYPYQPQAPSMGGPMPAASTLAPPPGPSPDSIPPYGGLQAPAGVPPQHAPPAVYPPYGAMQGMEPPRAPPISPHGPPQQQQPQQQHLPLPMGGSSASGPGAPPPPQMVSYPAPPGMHAYPAPPAVPSMPTSANYGRVQVPQTAYRGMQGSAPPQSAGGSGGGAPGPTSRTVPLEKIISDISQMGFSRSDVLAAVNSLQASGKALDLNTIIDKLTRG